MKKITMLEVVGGGTGRGDAHTLGYFHTEDEVFEFIRELNYGAPEYATVEMIQDGDTVYKINQLQKEADYFVNKQDKQKRKWKLAPWHEEERRIREEAQEQRDREEKLKEERILNIEAGKVVHIHQRGYDMGAGRKYLAIVMDRDTLDRQKLEKYRKGQDREPLVYTDHLYVLPKGNKRIREIDPYYVIDLEVL